MITLKKRLSINERIYQVYIYDLQNLSTKDQNDINDYFISQYNRYHKNYKYMVVHCNDDKHQFEFEYYKTLDELLIKYKSFDMFTKKDRSSFKYWFDGLNYYGKVIIKKFRNGTVPTINIILNMD